MTRRPTLRNMFLAGLLAASVSALGGVGGLSSAAAKAPDRVVKFHGYRVTVPASWPVFDLAADPSVCVRFDRHALYLGSPSPDARCPARAVGRTEAILIEPRDGARATRPMASDDSATSFVAASGKVAVTATWADRPAAIRRALSRQTLPRARTAAPARAQEPKARLAPRSAISTGLGFDACTAPSPAAMNAWASSPYRAVGIYIGGENRACAQPNLSAQWVSDRVAAGWKLIPTYVGAQAPGNSCGCSVISASNAAAQGAAAANAAAGQAQALGIPVGNPIYYDMEGYTRGGTTTPRVLTFLSAWTSQLHALGYVSGVYGSAASTISDLVDAYGSPGMVSPDAIWIANWNDKQTTDDPYVPADLWANQQRIHQYEGGHNETHGGVRINIDSNYLDGPTADTTPGAPPAPTPSYEPAQCVVPRLKGLKLRRARNELRRADCRLGEVKRPRHRVRHRVLLVTRHRPDQGRRLPERTPVDVTLQWRKRR